MPYTPMSPVPSARTRVVLLTASFCALVLVLASAFTFASAWAQNAQPTRASTPEPARSAAEENFDAGIAAFVAGDCTTAIPRLRDSVDDNTSVDSLILVTQILSACLAQTGDIQGARVLMRQAIPMIVTEKGRGSKALFDHNLTWAEFEISADAQVNAANRVTEGLTDYLSGDAVAASEALRGVAAYGAIMLAVGEQRRFLTDLDALEARNAQISWTDAGSLSQLLSTLPPLERNRPDTLGTWVRAALDASRGVAAFRALLVVEPEN